MINKILIANRGEIACRIIRTVKKLGLSSVAVYSDADANALHVAKADEAIYLGEAVASASYLDQDKIIQAALTSGADAIHPGYGFLSENAEFAEACGRNGIIFIGPQASSITAMGSKSAAKAIMQTAGVPLLPGYHGENQAADFLQLEAEKVGYPILLKAAAGGGGKGMRVVEDASQFAEALAAAQREANNAFANQLMLVEKYLPKPRHIEIQIFCDKLGNGVYLNERDCSIQRRHQKIIEESPAPGLSQALREKMGAAALDCAKAINYIGAGTVEFLLDTTGEFYFMEMNTRLQVEHPITEMTTGFDLVEWQILVANGQPLPANQGQVQIIGHAIEARIYAEDPTQEFLPQTGQLSFLAAPAESRHVRIDTGVRAHDEISIYYDPMISKLIVWDTNRTNAVNRLTHALSQYNIAGVTTNISFLYKLSLTQGFADANLDTGFIQTHADDLFSTDDKNKPLLLAAAAISQIHNHKQNKYIHANDPHSPWSNNDAWQLNEPNQQILKLILQGETFDVVAEHFGGNEYQLQCKFGLLHVAGYVVGDQLLITMNGRLCKLVVAQHDHNAFTLFLQGTCTSGQLQAAEIGEDTANPDAAGLLAPMNGKVVSLLVEPNAPVETGASLLIMEAMKMEHTIKAQTAGKVLQYHFGPGDLVEGGASLLDFEASLT
jgi:3-methylcrotonyl-CoA carboxylase alpha subunit